MAGREVSRLELDTTMSDNLIAARNAIDGLVAINAFLKRNPVGEDGVDPLTLPTTPTDTMDATTAPGKFGYTEEEAALIRQIFGQLDQLKPAIDPIFEEARALTGLA